MYFLLFQRSQIWVENASKVSYFKYLRKESSSNIPAPGIFFEVLKPFLFKFTLDQSN